MLRGSLQQIAKWQATEYDDRFDAQPGRVIHQRQLSPLALLEKTPFKHYYGDYSAPAWFLIDIAWDYLLSGDSAFFHSMLDKVLATLDWIDRDGDGFYEYATRAGKWGQKNQGWKDSQDAILYPDGRLVPDPLAVVEIQGCYYAAKRLIALSFRGIGEPDRAARLEAEAARLKWHFDEAFWLTDAAYYALALDPEKRPVRSIAADPGQCLVYGIIPDRRSSAVAARLMADDMFTGWGLRTLSAKHPAFNPFSYHLGSVWPVANAMIAFGLKRYGFVAEFHRLARALFDAAQLFELSRLPEVFGGHQRDRRHPHPGIYPETNSPQAWSAGAVVQLVQAMLGLVPAAPWGTLIIDPALPDWLPELTIGGLLIGDSRTTIRFWRDASGATRYDVTEMTGRVRIHRLPSGHRGVERIWPALSVVAAAA